MSTWHMTRTNLNKSAFCRNAGGLILVTKVNEHVYKTWSVVFLFTCISIYTFILRIDEYQFKSTHSQAQKVYLKLDEEGSVLRGNNAHQTRKMKQECRGYWLELHTEYIWSHCTVTEWSHFRDTYSDIWRCHTHKHKCTHTNHCDLF